MLVAASRKKLEGMASNLRKMAEAEAMQLNRAIDNLSAAAGTPAADTVRPPVLCGAKSSWESLLVTFSCLSQTGEGSSKDLPSKVFSETQVDGQT